MDAQTARKIPFATILEVYNIPFARKSGEWEMYKSPFVITQKTGSLAINIMTNKFFCHSSGNGGSPIDFIMTLENCDIRQALKILGDLSNLAHPVKVFSPIQTPSTITEVKKISNPHLISYLISRKIKMEYAHKYCQQIHYANNNKNYYGVGIKNELEGYEIRSPFFKGCVGPKSITFIEGYSNLLSIFEGFCDFLSFCSFKNAAPIGDVIILNSTSLINAALPIIRGRNPYHINAFLDNDEAGEKARRKLSDFDVTDMAKKLYPNHKDFNGFLTNSKH